MNRLDALTGLSRNVNLVKVGVLVIYANITQFDRVSWDDIIPYLLGSLLHKFITLDF